MSLPGKTADGSPTTRVESQLLQLKRAPEVESALEADIESLTDKNSPNSRHKR
jgi:hypothetical protein